MRVAETIGKVTLNKCHASVQGATWLLAVPLTLEGLAGKAAGRGESFVVFDELGAGSGTRIAVSEGTEAAAPFHPAVKPIDAYNAAILDTIEFESL
jgi:ethanolamine utilization protein EutN